MIAPALARCAADTAVGINEIARVNVAIWTMRPIGALAFAELFAKAVASTAENCKNTRGISHTVALLRGSRSLARSLGHRRRA